MPASAQVEVAPVALPAAEKAKKVKRSLKKPVPATEFGGPSKAKSGYFLFSDQKRAPVMDALRKEAETSGTKFAIVDVSKKLSEMWKALGEDAQKPFQEQAVLEKTKYDQLFADWKKSDQYKAYLKEVAAHKKKQADKKAHDAIKASGMPKKPQAGYLAFAGTQAAGVIAQLKAEGKPIDMKSRAALVKARWDALGEAGQAKFHEEAQVAKESYEKAMATFKESVEYKNFQKALEKNRKAKAFGDRLAKFGGDKELAKKKRKSKAAAKSGAKKQKLENGEAKAPEDEEDEDDDEDVEVELSDDEEEGEGEADEEEGEEEEGEGEEE